MDVDVEVAEDASDGLDSNEVTWNGCVFYDPSRYDNVSKWASREKCYGALAVGTKNAVVSLHPSFDEDGIRAFKRNCPRYAFVPDVIRARITENKMLIKAPENKHLILKHSELLDLAEQCDVWGGYWVLSCRGPYTTHKDAMQTYFCALSQRLRSDPTYRFIRIEATVDSWNGNGIVTVSVNDFTDLDVVKRIGSFIRDLVWPEDIAEVEVQTLCFKPEFYRSSNLDGHFSSDLSKNIYRYELHDLSRALCYEDGVQEWLAGYSRRRRRAGRAEAQAPHAED